MQVITLTTGWANDFYVSALKGILISSIPSVQIVDMTHQAPSFAQGISFAAYIVKQSYDFFPKGTIHILSIESEINNDSPFVAANYNGHYFVGTDNGIFGLLFDSDPDAMVRVEKFTDEASPNYPAISVFAPVAAHLANGGNINELGKQHIDYKKKGIALATLDKTQITGTVIHINAFGNAITNITREDFDRIAKGRSFEILVQRIRKKITRINKYFHETSHGEILAVFNMSGHLEIAQNKGNLSEMMKIYPGTNVIVKFLDK